MKITPPCLEHVKLVNLASHADARGTLTSIEGEIDTPFSIKRIFYMHHINSDRGGHAHIDTDQLIIASSGSFKIELSDGLRKISYKLNDPTKGIYVPRMIFITMDQFSKNSVCLVLASSHYDFSKSIRSWEDYINTKNQKLYSNSVLK